MQQINIDIAPDGGVSVDAAGFRGADCEQATRFLEQALGRVENRRRKPEYHQPAARRQSQRLGR